MIDPPFGAYRLPAWASALRGAMSALGDSVLELWTISAARKLALAGRKGPFDVTVFGQMRARVHPHDNRCEKRAFMGDNAWDRAERLAIERALLAAPAHRPFVFVDGGANVGLYSLSTVAQARRAQRPLQVLAIEPDPVNLRRLAANIEASAAHEITVAPTALGVEAGAARLLIPAANRGEVRLIEARGGEGETIEVPVRPLGQVLTEAGFTHVDVLKLDIEGFEETVLRGLFEQASRSLWPAMILLEVRKPDQRPAYELCLSHGYEEVQATRQNRLLRLKR